MANARCEAVDTTRLDTDGFIGARGMIHRDYLAHVLRYNHVVRYLQLGRRHQAAHVLDVGCGREAPLAATLFSSRLTHTTGSYTGVDYGPITRPRYLQVEREKFHTTWLERADFAVTPLPRAEYDVIVMLEAAEHVEALHAFRMLQRIRALLAPGGVAFISTPCFDPRMGAAANHVNEMTHGAFRTLLELAALEVEQVWGTFASQRDYKDQLKRYPGLPEVYALLGKYYDTNVIACMFAPLFPAQARNCLWRCGPGWPRAPLDVTAWAAPHNGSSALWTEHALEIYREVTGER